MIAAAGFAIDVLILLFTSHSSFINSVNDVAGPNAYQKTVDAGSRLGAVSRRRRLLHAR